jgi:hypothetical protein
MVLRSLATILGLHYPQVSMFQIYMQEHICYNLSVTEKQWLFHFKKVNFMKYFLISIFLSLSFLSKAQYSNLLTLPLYGSWFFNKYPYKLNRVFFINGIEYKKAIGNNANQGVFGNIVYTIIDYKKKNNEKWYDVRSTNGVPINSYYESNFAFFSLGYYYNQKISKYLNVSYKIGLNYRLESGNVLLLANYPDFEEIVVQNIEFNNTWGGDDWL